MTFEDVEISRRVEPPKNLPTPDVVEASDASFFAQTNLSAGLGEERKVFGILREDRRRHMYLIGKTGVGKTRLLEHLIRADIYFGHGVCVVDPNGDLVHDILDFIPKERIQDVILIDPSDVTHPVAWNPLADVQPADRHHVVSGIVEVFSRLFGHTWNPRAEHLLRFALLAMLESTQPSLVELLNFLTNADKRSAVVSILQPGLVKTFWEKDFPLWVASEDRIAISAVINTLTSFLSHPSLYAVFSGSENAIDLNAALRENKIVLVSIPGGTLGELNAMLFGSLFLVMFKRAAFHRASIAIDQRADYYLYVDEFQNVATESFLDMLSDGGRYGLCITASNQYLGQLAPPVKNAILGNVATLISFQVSAEDADFLQKEFAPHIEHRDMINLPIQEFYVKLSIQGRRFDPFSATTLGVERAKWSSERASILAHCHDKYSRKK